MSWRVIKFRWDFFAWAYYSGNATFNWVNCIGQQKTERNIGRAPQILYIRRNTTSLLQITSEDNNDGQMSHQVCATGTYEVHYILARYLYLLWFVGAQWSDYGLKILREEGDQCSGARPAVCAKPSSHLLSRYDWWFPSSLHSSCGPFIPDPKRDRVLLRGGLREIPHRASPFALKKLN